jgi:hypothetical protein
MDYTISPNKCNTFKTVFHKVCSWFTGLINSEHEQSSIKKQGGSLD